MIANKYDSNGVLWVRCNECGDSKQQWKGHVAIYDDGGFYCHKCGHSGRLTLDELLKIAMGAPVVDVIDEKFNDNRAEINVDRYTALDTYEAEQGADWVSIPMRDVNGEIVGYHNRHLKSKEFVNEGERGIGFAGQLKSTPARCLIVVEGPWDVLDSQHVCVFGQITNSVLQRYFRLQHVFLWPDPDILESSEKRKKFYYNVLLPAIDSLVNVHGIVVSDKDPDEHTIAEYMDVKRAKEWLIQ